MKITSTNAITCSTDYNYVNFLYKLLDSIEEHNIHADVYVRLVDFTEEQSNEVASRYNINLINDNPKLSSRRDVLKDVSHAMHYTYGLDLLNTCRKNIKKLLYSKRSVYTCHSRFKTINKLLEQRYKNILSLDVDTLVKKNIDHLFDNEEKYDLRTVTIIEEGIEYYFHNEGLLLIGNSNESRNFFGKIEDYIFNNGERYLEWNVDSEALENVYKDSNLSLGFIDKLYKDTEFSEEAYMWSGDTNSKYDKRFDG